MRGTDLSRMEVVNMCETPIRARTCGTTVVVVASRSAVPPMVIIWCSAESAHTDVSSRTVLHFAVLQIITTLAIASNATR